MNNKFQLLNEGLVINKISKSFGSKQVVREISLTLQRGEIVGLLGANGAGKTTVFSMISGLVQPDSGEIFLNGRSVFALRANFATESLFHLSTKMAIVATLSRDPILETPISIKIQERRRI